jgi:Rrf2 family transcriptional regulator, iron-sulfur cluster assembly transcription factor
LRLTTKTRYAVRALFDLAYHCRGRAAQAREIAERQGVPLRFLEQTLQALRKAGLVDGRRGPKGGYTLAKSPETVKLGDVIRATQGMEAQVVAFDDDETRSRDRRRKPRPRTKQPALSPTKDVPALMLKEIAARFTAELDAVTLQDFVARAECLGIKRGRDAALMYYI